MNIEETSLTLANLNFIVERDQLLQSLAYINSIVEKRNNVAVLSCVKIEAHSNIAKFIATDLDLSIVSSLTVDFFSKVEAVVSAHLLYDIVRKLPANGKVKFNLTSKKNLQVVCGNANFSLPTTETERFPLVGNNDLECNFSLKTSELLSLFGKTKFAISIEETRYNLNGVYFHIHDNMLCCASTDSHRLSVVKIPKPKEINKDFAIIIPRKTVTEIIRIISNPDEECNVSISLSDRKICFTHKNYLIISKLIDGVFPDYNSIIPNKHDKFMIVSSCLLAQIVDRVSVIVADKVKSIKFKLSSNKLILVAKSSDQSNSMESLEVDYTGDDLEIGFNSRYLMDIFSCIKETCRFSFFNQNTAVIVKDQGFENATYVIMPMSI